MDYILDYRSGLPTGLPDGEWINSQSGEIIYNLPPTAAKPISQTKI